MFPILFCHLALNKQDDIFTTVGGAGGGRFNLTLMLSLVHFLSSFGFTFLPASNSIVLLLLFLTGPLVFLTLINFLVFSGFYLGLNYSKKAILVATLVVHFLFVSFLYLLLS